jgi:hypothetical protein
MNPPATSQTRLKPAATVLLWVLDETWHSICISPLPVWPGISIQGGKTKDMHQKGGSKMGGHFYLGLLLIAVAFGLCFYFRDENRK